MIGKANHYGSRFAAQKAGAAFRRTAKVSGNPTDSLGIISVVWRGLRPQKM